MTSRSSSCASRALTRITAAARAISSGEASGIELERAGVDAQQGDPVREHVVHLARDPRSFAELSLADAQVLLVLGAARPLLQRQQQLAPGPYVRAEARRPRP